MARAYVGTSGFDYKEWKPDFYPEELPKKDFLRYYATRFRSLELNSTFYRMPNQRNIAAWRAATPEDFRFALKVSRKITHMERLRTPSESLDYFVRTVVDLEKRLGAVLFQLPPTLKCDTERLAALFDAVPDSLPAAIEFRHDSWFVEEVYRILEDHSAALCIHDADDKTTPVRVTSKFVYMRLRRSSYPPELRKQWLDRMGRWLGQGRDVYAYIKHEDNPDAPRMALEFAAAL